MTGFRLICCGGLFALLAGTTAHASAADAIPNVLVPVASAQPALDGRIDDSWAAAADADLSWDQHYQRRTLTSSRAHLLRFRDTLYVAVEVRGDRAPVVTQRTDGSGVLNDDNVEVLLWPDGATGFAYSFVTNAAGVRYQTSSENSAYAADWRATGKALARGYVVEMAIPLGAIRTSGKSSWRAQIVLNDVVTGSQIEWVHVPEQQSVFDVLFAAMLDGLNGSVDTSVQRPKPRLQVYALAATQDPVSGANAVTSRLGLDAAIPVSRTASVLASFHPDYSDVEIDQQTIAPTEFQRTFQEVRPFFTQGAGFYNVQACAPSCPYQLLYTPAIATFRDGYAYEGQVGNFGIGAFDAVGTARSDAAQSVSYTSSNQAVYGSAQRIAVSTTNGFRDDVTLYDAGYANPHSHVGFFANLGEDESPFKFGGDNTYRDAGASISSSTASASVTLRKLGADFAPADGYVSHADIAGWAGQIYKQFNLPEGSPLRDVSISAYGDRYHAHDGTVNQDDDGYQINFDLRSQATVHFFQNSRYLALPDGEYLPFSENGFFVGLQQQTATPVGLLVLDGPYYHGRSSYQSFTLARRLGKQVTASAELDRTAYAPGAGYTSFEPSTEQWLQRVGLDWQISQHISLDVGARRIFGASPPTSFSPPSLNAIKASNISAALHMFGPRSELYLVYGDPNVLSTSPTLTLKLIRYVGAAKGT